MKQSRKLTRAEKIYMSRILGAGYPLKGFRVIRETPWHEEIRDSRTGVTYLIDKADI